MTPRSARDSGTSVLVTTACSSSHTNKNLLDTQAGVEGSLGTPTVSPDGEGHPTLDFGWQFSKFALGLSFLYHFQEGLSSLPLSLAMGPQELVSRRLFPGTQ